MENSKPKHECSCGKSFSRKFDLKRHQSAPTACKDPNDKICASCGRIFIGKTKKERHESSCFRNNKNRL